MVPRVAEREVRAFRDFVAAWPDRRPNRRNDPLRSDPVERLQRLDAGDDGSLGHPAPAGMNCSNCPPRLFRQEHRHAVRDTDGDGRCRIVADDGIGLRTVPGPRPIGGGNGDGVFVHLPDEEHVLARHGHRLGHRFPLGHVVAQCQTLAPVKK